MNVNVITNRNTNVNISDLTNNMFTLQINTNVPKSYDFHGRSIIKFYEFMPDIVNNISPIDRLAFNTYSHKGDYYVNKFLFTDIFSKSGMNQRTYKAFTTLPMFKKLIKRFVSSNMNRNAIVNSKQEIIYYLFVMRH